MSVPLFTEHFVGLAGPNFTADCLGQDFVRVEAGAEAVAGLLDWPELNEILSTRPLDTPQLRLHRDGPEVPVERYTRENTVGGQVRRLLQPEDVYRELRDGASLVLDSIDRLHPPITAAADDLMRLVRELVQVNLYLVWGGGQGFNTHWDDHDTVIVQLAGTKSWAVHGPGRAYPMKADVDHDHSPPDATVWKGILSPGDIIHVPRGWWHTVRGTGGMSMHLTFGFTRRTGVDWAKWVVEQLYEEELFRQDLPRFAPQDRRRAHHDDLVRSLTKIVAEHPPEQLLDARDRRFPRRPEINLPWPVEFQRPDDSARIVATALLEPTVYCSPDAVEVAIAGKNFRFAPVMAPLLQRLA
ncbi:MAG: JmjC domain-containing protein [Pseudonocardiaceae bacterium]